MFLQALVCVLNSKVELRDHPRIKHCLILKGTQLAEFPFPD